MSSVIINPYSMASGGTTFDPTSIAGLQFWLDASDSTTLFDAQPTGGSLPADGAGVKRIEDKSGNARHAVQGTAGIIPLRDTGFINSLDVIDFDGTDDYLLWEHTGFSIRTAFYVFRLDTTTFAGYDGIFLANTFSPGLTTAPDNNHGISGVISDSKIWTNDTSADGVWIDGVSATLADFKSFSAGIAITAQSPVLCSYTRSNTGTGDKNACIGRDPYQGGGTRAFNGQICEVVFYDTVLGTSDRQSVESYLMTKWGI